MFVDVVALIVCGVVGLVAHWAKRWVREQTDATLYEYYFVRERKATLSTVITFCAGMFGLLATTHLLSPGAAYAAFSIGYLIDSAVNNG